MGINGMIEWSRDARPDPAQMVEAAGARLCEVLDLLEAIETCELLSELPVSAAGGRRHQCAASMLSIVRRELASVVADLDVAQSAVEAISPPVKPRAG